MSCINFLPAAGLSAQQEIPLYSFLVYFCSIRYKAIVVLHVEFMINTKHIAGCVLLLANAN